MKKTPFGHIDSSGKFEIHDAFHDKPEYKKRGHENHSLFLNTTPNDRRFISDHPTPLHAQAAAQKLVDDKIKKRSEENEMDWRPAETIPEDHINLKRPDRPISAVPQVSSSVGSTGPLS